MSKDEREYRVRVRSNITRALTALDLTTVSDIQQTSAALAQCTVSGAGEANRKGWLEKKSQVKKSKQVNSCVWSPGGESRVHLRGVSKQHSEQTGDHA